jgi:hypothetical protein
VEPQITHQIHTHFYWPDQSWPRGARRWGSVASIVIANALMVFGIWELNWEPSYYLLLLWFDMVLLWGLFSARVAMRHASMQRIAISMFKFQLVAVFLYAGSLWGILEALEQARQSANVTNVTEIKYEGLSWVPFLILFVDLMFGVIPLYKQRDQVRHAWSESPGFWVFYAPFYQEAMMRSSLLVFGAIVLPLVMFEGPASNTVRLSYLIYFAAWKTIVDLYWTSGYRIRRMKKRMVKRREKHRQRRKWGSDPKS